MGGGSQNLQFDPRTHLGRFHVLLLLLGLSLIIASLSTILYLFELTLIVADPDLLISFQKSSNLLSISEDIFLCFLHVFQTRHLQTYSYVCLFHNECFQNVSKTRSHIKFIVNKLCLWMCVI